MVNSYNFGFGARLKEARKRAGLTGAELGVGVGDGGKDASKASVSDWEHDRHYPKADQLRAICLKLNISSDHLVFGDIKEELNLIQAETTIQMLNPEQRRALLAKMMGDAAPDEAVEQKMPITRKPRAPSPVSGTTENIDRVNPEKHNKSQLDTQYDKDKEMQEWVTKEQDGTSEQRDPNEGAPPERRRSKGG